MTTIKRFVHLEQDIDRIKAELREREAALQDLQRRCPHNWGKVEYTPEIHEGYQDPGDPPGTMGVDWRGPMWVPRQEIPIWSRKCSECGLVQETMRTRDETKKIPEFSDRRY
jgi:hypothetical protein